MHRFSANLGFLWSDLPLLERIDRAASAGFRAIELHWPYDTPADAVRKACEKHRLTLLGINTAVGDAALGEFGLGALAGREADFQAAIDQSLAFCRNSGANAVHAMAGIVPSRERAKARDIFLRNLAEAAQKAAAQGVTLLLEPINPRDKPDYFYSTVGEAVSIIEDLRSDTVRLMFDAYHVGVAEGDVIMKLRRYKDLIGHVQIAAVPSRTEPDEGEISYSAIFAELRNIGYAGFIGCEYKPRAKVEDGLVWTSKLNAWQ
ncbi:TIM barrel protein [Mesorhizobium sp. CU2]|uniref:hydroxypyruvate isomerase family protein n=1 Tax=unclassified Mesorhizobium TaxID=325217 RepID=UPI00112CD45B|nr:MULTISPECIES: TIM barrel protein [unclassified Mesorhizobium]TPN81051.1 TIM barrel protein [Mesorhizobium sp. CU3]TPO05731.1 TIM barrel protein [Mesorhizobium sp. CU2]